MRVRALKTFASLGIAPTEGDEFEVGDELGQGFIKAGLVVRIPVEPQTATRSSAETAVSRGRR